MDTDFDIAVIGGGLSGFAAALGAAQSGQRVFHVAPAGGRDPRTSALMMPTLAFLQELGVFDSRAPLGEPLAHIHLIDCTQRLVRAGETHLSADEIGEAAFGYNIANADLLSVLAEACGGSAHYEGWDSTLVGFEGLVDGGSVLTLADGHQVQAQLVVGADGKGSAVRGFCGAKLEDWSYPQSALVCDLACGADHEATSFELHYEFGPFTLVPAGGQKSNLVWVDEPEVLVRALELSPVEFEALLMEKSHGILGDLKLLSKRVVFPLAGGRATQFGQNGCVLVGEAAHYFPPIGAQGLNLGLRDGAALVGLLKDTSLLDVPAAYHDLRAQDVRATTFLVDTLNRSLLSGFLPVQMARSLGVWALGNSAQLRGHAFRAGMGM